MMDIELVVVKLLAYYVKSQIKYLEVVLLAMKMVLLVLNVQATLKW